MASIPFKPKHSPVWKILKDLKNGFDDPSYDILEPALEREAMLLNNAFFRVYQGEVLHQLALRSERRKDVTGATRRYESSIRAFGNDEPLGLAKVLRDYGVFLCYSGDLQSGLERTREALVLHGHDVNNRKGARQERLTLAYLWRAEVLAGENAQEALELLTEFALTGCLDCSPRDQLVVINFVLAQTSDLELRLELDARQLEINLERKKRIRALMSLASIVIDTEKLLVKRAFHALFRKE